MPYDFRPARFGTYSLSLTSFPRFFASGKPSFSPQFISKYKICLLKIKTQGLGALLMLSSHLYCQSHIQARAPSKHRLLPSISLVFQ